MKEQIECVIIGAGISGLMAGHQLKTAGLKAVILDKGRGVGGRMAHRRMTLPDGQLARFDHGAQYFTVRSEQGQHLVKQWLELGIVKEWAQGFLDSEGEPHINGVPRYVCPNGMTAIAKYLAQDLDVKTATRVSQVQFDQTYKITLDNGETIEANSLIMTPPVPQSLDLLEAGGVGLDEPTVSQLKKIEYAPCFAVLCALEAPSKIPAPGGLWPVGGEPISWIADNQQKGISDVPTVTIHASQAFSRQHFDGERDDTAKILVEAAQDWLGVRVNQFMVHRWKYSIPTMLHNEPILFSDAPAPIVFAGDAFAGPRVEGAILSGLAAGALIHEKLEIRD